MKNTFKFATLMVTAAIAVSCTSESREKTQTSEAMKSAVSSFDQTLPINPDESKLSWEGYKPTGQHHGTVTISSGELMVKEGMLAGGKFTFDMNTITVLDLDDEDMNKKLTAHLKSADFFEVENYPEASFEITEVEPIDMTNFDRPMKEGEVIPTHALTGNLMIKGISKSITFHAKVDFLDDIVMTESNMFFIDRTEWNVQYKSKKVSAKFKDDFINDDMGIKLKIVAGRA